MSDAPERIWISPFFERLNAWGSKPLQIGDKSSIEYIRADLHDPQQFNIAYAKQAERIAELEQKNEVLTGALADIAFSDDMTIELARKKAKRIYALTQAGDRE